MSLFTKDYLNEEKLSCQELSTEGLNSISNYFLQCNAPGIYSGIAISVLKQHRNFCFADNHLMVLSETEYLVILS